MRLSARGRAGTARPARSGTLRAGRAERRPARAVQRQFTAQTAAARGGHHNNVRSAARGRRRADPTAAAAEPAASCAEFRGPGVTVRGDRRLGGRAPLASQLRQVGGLLRHREVPVTVAPSPARARPPPLGERGEVKPLPLSEETWTWSEGTALAPVPAAAAPGPARSATSSAAAVLRSASALMGGPAPPRPRSGPPSRPRLPKRSDSPQRGPSHPLARLWDAGTRRPPSPERSPPARSSPGSGIPGLTPAPPALHISPVPCWGRSALPGRGKTWSPARPPPPPPPPRYPPSPRLHYNPIPRRG